MTEKPKTAPTPSTANSAHGISFLEISTLLDYTIRHGLDRNCTFVNSLGKKLEEEAATKESPSIEAICLYAKLCLLTKPVTGRSLLGTSEIGDYLSNIARMAVLFLLIAITNESLNIVYTDTTSDGILFDLHNYFLNPITPFIWGALGSCVFLLKRLSDLAAAGAFDSYKLQGWKTRIVLGAILGGIMQFIYDPASFVGSELSLDANAIAFITGVGVRVVYGAIEKTIAVLAEKLNLQSLSRQSEGSPVASWLNEQLAKADADKETEKRKLLLELLDEINQPRPNA